MSQLTPISSSPTISARTCGKCTSSLPSNGDYAVCSSCSGAFHFNQCSGIAPNTWERKSHDKKAAWRCSDCRKVSEQPTLLDIKTVLNRMDSKIEEIQTAVTRSDDKLTEALLVIQELKKENESLKKENKELKERIDNLDQYSRSNNVVINNLPMSDNEDIEQIVKRVGEITGTPIVSGDIDCCHRLRKSPKQQHPSIIVRFCRRSVKQDLLKKSKRLNVTHNQLGVPVDVRNQKVYINEHLTSGNVRLYTAAKSLREHGFKFVWCRDGKIFAREHEHSVVIRITSPEQISAVASGQIERGQTQL